MVALSLLIIKHCQVLLVPTREETTIYYIGIESSIIYSSWKCKPIETLSNEFQLLPAIELFELVGLRVLLINLRHDSFVTRCKIALIQHQSLADRADEL